MHTWWQRLINILFNKHYIWREIFNYGILAKKSRPREWLKFRHALTKQCAMMREQRKQISTVPIAHCHPTKYLGPCSIVAASSSVYNVSAEELLALTYLTRATVPKNIFEFGTFDGRTTLHFGLNSTDDCKIYSIDICGEKIELGTNASYMESVRVGECLANSDVRNKVHLLTGDSATYNFTRFEGTIDLVFVDGDHSYEGVLRDSRQALKMLRAGGTIVWHDYLLLDGVTAALNLLSEELSLQRIKDTTLVVYNK